MKTFTLTLFFSVVIFFAKAQNPVLVSTNLETVRVYRSGAALQHSAKVNLPSGNTQLVLGNIANLVDVNSIQLTAPSGVTILSTTFVKDYLKTENKTVAYLKIEDSLKTAMRELSVVSNKKVVDENLLSLLDKNQTVSGANSGLSVAELIKMAEYYKTKQLELRGNIYNYEILETAQQKKVNRLRQQLVELSADKSGAQGQLLVEILVKEAKTVDFMLSYLTPSASWNPFYDLRGENTSSPLKIVYRANVTQYTGIDWKKVKLSLSTGMPTQNGTAPLLSAWFLRYHRDVEDLLKKMPGLEVSNTIGTIRMKASSKDFIEVRQDTADLNDQNFAVVDLATQSNSTLNTNFEIDIPYDIASDSKAHSVILNTYNHPVKYKYYSVPKLENDVFLLAEITNYEKLNLLRGNANIIFENTYVGKSLLDPNTATDTLNLSMGRDKRIVVKREKVAEQSALKVIGSNRKQTFTYEITLRNGKTDAVELMLKDQFPVSTDKTIEIELLQSDGAAINPETGILTWKITLQPSVTQKVRVSYSVKYPKELSIANL